MKKSIIVSDFDGTVSTRDSLYGFFEEYAQENWTVIEELWRTGEIGSKECLIKEFELVPDLSESLIDKFTSTIEIDAHFKEFQGQVKSQGIDFVIVSDGVDYFINRILSNNGIEGVDITSNHGEFVNGKFLLSFPNGYSICKNDSGTCKCKVVEDLRQNYDLIYYIGDGVSDFCVADKADILFAKKSLAEHCRQNDIEYTPYNNFGDIAHSILQEINC